MIAGRDFRQIMGQLCLAAIRVLAGRESETVREVKMAYQSVLRNEEVVLLTMTTTT